METETPLCPKVENAVLRVLIHFYGDERDDYEANPNLRHVFWDLETIRVWALESEAAAGEGRAAQ